MYWVFIRLFFNMDFECIDCFDEIFIKLINMIKFYKIDFECGF